MGKPAQNTLRKNTAAKSQATRPAAGKQHAIAEKLMQGGKPARKREPGVVVERGRRGDGDYRSHRKPQLAKSKRGAAWKLQQYEDLHTMWEAGARPEDIAQTLYLGKRKVKEMVAEFNRLEGTPRQRQRRRRLETATSWQLVSVRSGGRGKARAMNMKELNGYVVEKRGWAGTSYWATRRDALASGIVGHVVRVARSRTVRGAASGKSVHAVREAVRVLGRRLGNANLER